MAHKKLIFLIFGLACIAVCCLVSSAAAESKPNIVLIMADDFGRECLQCYGGESYDTPHLDRLAAEGVQFNHCYSTPICTTSRVQLMTGKYNFRNYECFAYLDPQETTFGHLLKGAGYQTMIAGKWQLNGHNSIPRKPQWDDINRPQQAGFDESHLWQVHRKKGERYWGSELVVNGTVVRLTEKEYTPDYFTDQICQFIERNRDEPFFVYYPMVLTHAPFVRTPKSKGRGKTRQELFSNMVRHTDSIVGRIDGKLQELGLSSNTLLMFTGDNGTDRSLVSQWKGTTLTGGKATPVKSGIHVPLICKWPGNASAGQKIDSLVDFTDFFATFSELVDAQIDDTPRDGISFLPALLNRKGPKRTSSICHYDCRWGRFPAVQFAYDTGFKVYRDGRIFSLLNDPNENRPVDIGELDSDDKKRVQQLQSKLSKLPKLTAATLVPGPRMEHSPEKPNVILLMADDLGWGDVGFNGNNVIQTPHLNQMAKAGMKFNRFYAQSAVCSPTRGSCLTGRHPFRYGILGANVGHLWSGEETLAELTSEYGYQTGHFGKWHLGTLNKTFSGKGKSRKPDENFMPPSGAGFNDWFSTEFAVATWDPYDPQNAHEKKHAGDPRVLYWENGNNVTSPLVGDDSRIIVDRAIAFMDQQVKSELPFFAVIWFHAPHKPVVAGPKYRAMYSQYPESAQHYYGCITAMDEQVGRVRAFLRVAGVANNTVLCFCSDNGPEGKSVGEGTSWGTTGGLRGRKRSLYEGGIRVPAVIEWPSRIKAGAVCNVPCVTSDYFPTVAEILGCCVDRVRNCDGQSLVRVFDGTKRRFKPIGFIDRQRSVWMENELKLIVHNDGRRELYDVEKTPTETDNLSKSKPKRTADMLKRLSQWKSSVENDRRSSAVGSSINKS